MKLAYWEKHEKLVAVPLPRGWGVAWQDFSANRVYLMRVPLNRIAAVARDAWLLADRFLRHDRSIVSRREKVAYRAGYSNGRNDGAMSAYTWIIREIGRPLPPNTSVEERADQLAAIARAARQVHL